MSNSQTRQAFATDADRLQQSPSDRLSGVPGQSIEQVRQWVNNHSFLPPLKPVEQLEQGYPDYPSFVTLGKFNEVTLFQPTKNQGFTPV